MNRTGNYRGPTLVLAAALCLAAGAARSGTPFTPEWNDTVKIDRDPAQNTVWLRNPKLAGFLSAEPKSATPLVDVAMDGGHLVIDTRAFKQAHPDGKVVLRLNQLPFAPEHRIKEMALELALSGAPAGLKGLLYFEGNQGADKKHYWKSTEFLLGETGRTVRFEQILPGDLNELHLRCDLLSAGVYRLAQAAYGETAAAPVDAAVNHIVNGGAELGWYGVGTYGMNNLAQHDDNLVYDGRGKTWTGTVDAVLDRDVRHGGRYAFRLTGGADRTGSLYFNSVPFLPGKPAAYSVWLKADAPNTPVQLNLFLANGIAYGRRVMAGTDWKRHELVVANWGGDDVPGGGRVGDVVNGYGAVYKQVSPRIDVERGTVWVDDAAYRLGPAADPAPPAATAVRGRLEPAAGYVRAGTPLKAVFTLEGGPARDVAVAWEAVDFFGKRVAAAPAVPVALKADGAPVDATFALPLPPVFRGPVTWRFTVDGRPYHFLGGVIGPDAPQLARLGTNYDPRQNAVTAAKLLKDFRFGSVRVWSNYRDIPYQGFRDVPVFKDNGFYVMLCLGLTGAAPGFQVPLDFAPWQAELRREAAKVKGRVDSYEILNESNIWSGRVPVKEPDKYEDMSPAANVRVIRAAAEALRAVDPAAKIAGPASCHTDINWTANILKGGADRYLDIVTEHPYRELPELPDYEDDLRSLRAVLDRYKPDFPLVASEAGERSVHIFPHNEIPDFERVRTGYNVRMMLIGLANGLEQYSHFSFDMTGAGTAWNLTLTGNPDNGTLPVPAPVMYALRNLADRIGNAKPAGRVRLGADYRCYVFDRGDRRVAALWKWNGDPAPFALPDGMDGATVYDVMGNPLERSGLSLGPLPVYLESPEPAGDFLKRLATAAGTGGAAVAAELVVTGEKSFALKIRNLGGAPASGEVRLATPGVAQPASARFENIPGEGEALLPFTALAPISPADRPLAVDLALAGKAPERKSFNLKSILVPRAAKPLAMDGDLSDWPAASVFANLAGKDAVKQGAGWTAKDDAVAAELRLAWDDDYLYFAAVVDKADYVENGVGPARLWGGDGLQIAFDPLRNATPDLAGYQDDDYEFSVGRFQGKPLVYMHAAAAARHDSVDKTLGLADSVKAAIATTGGKTVYEVAFPRLLVSPFRLQPNQAMRFNVIVNVNNGTGRVGWLEFVPGIGQTPKRPGEFMDLVLRP